MRIDDLDYHLPEELIAQRPLEDRSASRLLVLRKDTGKVEHRRFAECPDLLERGDLLVMNDTRVTALRLFGRRPSGGQVEALLLHELPEAGAFEALTKPAKRLKIGERVAFEGGLDAIVAADLGDGRKRLEFDTSAGWDRRLREIGQTPLPPYIREHLPNAERYQTTYAATPGSAAAPTAGLHFTREIFAQLEARGVRTARVTLDVGLDTFRPIAVDDVRDHKMHGERCAVSEQTAEAVAKCQGRVIAVGTTSVRTLESFACGFKRLETGEKTTTIFISPGFEFKIIDGMFTNLHMPRTTMLVMLSALVPREALMSAYEEAVRDQYRFLSFGDSMLIL